MMYSLSLYVNQQNLQVAWVYYQAAIFVLHVLAPTYIMLMHIYNFSESNKFKGSILLSYEKSESLIEPSYE